jgi:ribosomal-protein-alanine N-acetyltransferase
VYYLSYGTKDSYAIIQYMQKTLKTDRLILRPPKIADAKVLAKLINNIRVSQNLLVVAYPNDPKRTQRFIKKHAANAKKKSPSDIVFIITDAATKMPMGVIGIHDISEFSGTATIGYWLGEPYWGNGYMSEAVNRVIPYLLKDMKLRRIEGMVFPHNTGSQGVLLKAGFKREGVKRKSCRCKATGKIQDEIIFGLVRK